MKGLKILLTSSVILLLNLASGCKQEIDYRQVENINGLIYKIKGDEPFTGTISNQPSTIFETVSEGTCQVPISKGLIHGPVTCKDQSNRKLLDTEFVYGKRNGTEIYYFPDSGKIYKSLIWNSDVKNGPYSIYDNRTGHLRLQRVYVNGAVSGPEKAWDDQGNLVADLILVDNRPFQGFDKRQSKERYYEDGAMHGRQIDYSKGIGANSYPISSEKYYQHGIPDGRWVEYDDRGRQTKISVYKNGVLLSEDERRWDGDRLKYKSSTIQTNPNATKDNYLRTLKKEERISALSDRPRAQALNTILGYEIDQKCLDQRINSFLNTNGEDAIVSEKDLKALEEKCSKKTKDPFFGYFYQDRMNFTTFIERS